MGTPHARREVLRAIGATGALTVTANGFVSTAAADGDDCEPFGCDGNPPGIITLAGGSADCPARFDLAVSGVIINADSGPDVDYDDDYYTRVTGELADEEVTFRFSGHITKLGTSDGDLYINARQRTDQ